METGTTRFEELKKEILIRAHKAEACREQYGRAYGAETLDALMEVVRDNFGWCCENDVLDGDIIDRYKAEFNAGKIWHNEAIVTDGMLLLENSSAVLWDNSRAVLRENSSAVLWDNSSAVLWDNSRAELRENSSAVLRGNSRAVLRENSRAELRDNSRAVLRENSRAVLRENSRAELRENSSAVLRGNSRAVLRENSSAVLWDNSRAELWDNSYVISYSIKECKLHDHAIYRIRETNEVRYVDENIRLIKVEEAE